MPHDQILTLKLKDILPNDNPRQEMDQTAMGELMASMKGNGLLSPIGVRKLPTGRYKLVFGGRRLIAAERLGWDKIQAVMVSVTDEKDALLKTSTENVIRENVSLTENGRIFSMLLKKGLTSEQIAIRMGCSKRFVLNAMEAFNRIPKEFHDRITYGTRGTTKVEGSVPATVALTAVDIKKKNSLTDKQTGQLMEWAAKIGANVVKMNAVGAMVAEGADVKEATKQVDFMKTISFTVTMKIATITQLQRRHDKKIHDIIYDILRRHPELDLVEYHKGKGGNTLDERYRRKENLLLKRKGRRNR